MLADTPDDFNRQASPVFRRTAPTICALICARRSELIEKIALRTHDFNAVISGFACECRGSAKILDGLEDFIFTQGAGRKRIDAGPDCGGSHQFGMPAVPARMQELENDLSALIVDSACDHTMTLNEVLSHDRRALCKPSRPVRRDTAGNKNSDAALCASCEEFGLSLETVRHLLEAGVHRSHQNAVSERSKPEIERCKQMSKDIWRFFHFDQFPSVRA